MNIVWVRGTGTIVHECGGPGDTCPVLAVHVALLVRHVSYIHRLDVQISRPVLTAAATGRVGDGAAAGACRHCRHVSCSTRVAGPRCLHRVSQPGAAIHNKCRSVGFSGIVISELSLVLFAAALCCNTLFVLNGRTITFTSQSVNIFSFVNPVSVTLNIQYQLSSQNPRPSRAQKICSGLFA